MEGLSWLGYLQNPKIRNLTGFLHLYSYSSRPALISFQRPRKAFAVVIFALKGQKSGDLTVSSISRETKWLDLTVKEYQRKYKAQIKLKSISEAAKSIRSAISKQVNIKGLHPSQRSSKGHSKLIRSRLVHINAT